jgi:predicted TPR repeat methyltransferase
LNSVDGFDVDVFQGYLREAKCHLSMGEIATAIHVYDKVLQIEPANATAKNEVMNQSVFHLFLFDYLHVQPSMTTVLNFI